MLTNMAALTLTDKAATPVNHSFTPVRSENGAPTWADKEHLGGIAIGYSKIVYTCREPLKVNGVYRQNLNLNVPFVDSSVPTKPVLLGTARVKCEFLFPDIMSDQNRKDVVSMFYTLLGQGSATALGDNIVNQTEPY